MAIFAVAAMLGATGIARASLPSNTAVSMQSEFVKGAYVNMTVRYFQGTIYRNSTVVSESLQASYRYALNYTVTEANTTSFNETLVEVAPNTSFSSYPTLKILWPSSSIDTIGAQYPYTNDTNASDYITVFKGMFSLTKNVSASVTSTTYRYNGLGYDAINATVSGLSHDNLGYSVHPSVYSVVFSPYSGIIFSSILNQSELILANGPNGTTLRSTLTRFSGSSFQLNSTSMVVGGPSSAGNTNYLVYAIAAAVAAVIIGAVVIERRRKRRL